MRWLGQMQRAFEIMCNYALKREAFGSALAEKQTCRTGSPTRRPRSRRAAC